MKVLTANRLDNGAVAYLAGEKRWTHSIDGALRLDPESASQALILAQAAPDRLIGPYLIDADEAGATGRERLRETIRAAGPTVGHSVKAARHVPL